MFRDITDLRIISWDIHLSYIMDFLRPMWGNML